jgi:hypothetical protein
VAWDRLASDPVTGQRRRGVGRLVCAHHYRGLPRQLLVRRLVAASDDGRSVGGRAAGGLVGRGSTGNWSGSPHRAEAVRYGLLFAMLFASAIGVVLLAWTLLFTTMLGGWGPDPPPRLTGRVTAGGTRPAHRPASLTPHVLRPCELPPAVGPLASAWPTDGLEGRCSDEVVAGSATVVAGAIRGRPTPHHHRCCAPRLSS